MVYHGSLGVTYQDQRWQKIVTKKKSKLTTENIPISVLRIDRIPKKRKSNKKMGTAQKGVKSIRF